MGVGVVIRDDASGIVAVKSKLIPYIIEPNHAETVVAWFALDFGRQLGGRRIILEGDSMVVVSALHDSGSCNRAFGQMIDDIKESFSQFDFVLVSHVCREGNRAAHVMAKCAISQILDNI
jgi:ribonuclease HI